jgi:putative transport protein
MAWVSYAVTNAPEIFILLAVALGGWLGRIRIHGFAIGATACTLVVAVILGQFGHFVIPSMLRSIFFGLFVFTIGYRSGPEFFASLNIQTLGQVVLALVMGGVGLVVVLAFAHVLHLDSGTAAGMAAGSLTQSSMMGTALGALSQLGLDDAVMKQQQANVAAGYAVTYILGYIIVLLFVPLVAPRLMGVNLKDEASKLEAELSGAAPSARNNLHYRKFQVRAYLVSAAAGSNVKDIEAEIGMRTVIERILRDGKDVEVKPDTVFQAGDEILIAGPSAAIVPIAPKIIGTEIEGEHVMRSVPGDIVEVFVTARELHGQTLGYIVNLLGDQTRGLFLRSLVRRGQEVPVSPLTRIYVGDVMTLIGLKQDLSGVIARIGQPFRSDEKTDVAFLAGGLSVGLIVGLISLKIGAVPLTLGGGGGGLVAGLICGWLRSRRPIMGAFPPAAQQSLVDIGLGAFIACIGLANGPAALAAIQAHGLMLLLVGTVVTLTPLIAGTLFAHRVLRMNPVIVCGALAGAMTVDAAVTGCCEVAQSQTPVLGVAVPYAIANVVLTVLGPIIVSLTAIA